MENFWIDYKLIIAQLINFGVFFLIFKKYVYKPFKEMLKEEKTKEEKKNKLDEEFQKQEELVLKKQQDLDKRINLAENKALEEIKSKNEQIKKELLERTEVEIIKIKEKAKKEIEYEKNKLYEDIKNKIIQTSYIIVNKILKSSLDENTKKKFTDMVIKEIPEIKYEN